MMDWKQVHFVGIGGTGLSAIARVLLERGYVVTGSDRSMTPMAKSLQESGVQIAIGHRASNLAGAQVVVRSSAIPDDNVELLEARAQGLKVLKRSEFLASLMDGYFCIAVAGTHGKTTTSAMIAWMLTSAGQDPSYIVGGVLKNTGTNAHAGNGQAFVIEADEYDYMFLGLRPNLAVITNIEHDHPDCYPTEADFFDAFDEFAGIVGHDGTLLVCVNDHNAAKLGEIAKMRGQNVLSYAINNPPATSEGIGADYIANELQSNQAGGISWKLAGRQIGVTNEHGIDLRVPGQHNVQNALAALAVAHQLQLPLGQAGKALSDFTGTGRRFELRAEVNGISIIDDYAHHPTEIKATLAAAHSRYPERQLWVVWQPHTYSRTRLLFSDFAHAFDQADHVVVTEIYAARETQPEDGFSSQDVVDAMSHADVRYIGDFTQVSSFLVGNMQPGDVLLVLSAGDADQVSKKVQVLLEERSGKND